MGTRCRAESELRLKCCDMIIQKFLRQHGERISARALRDALAYTYVSRGRLFEAHDRSRALRYYLRAMLRKPLQLPAYKGIVRAALFPHAGRG